MGVQQRVKFLKQRGIVRQIFHTQCLQRVIGNVFIRESEPRENAPRVRVHHEYRLRGDIQQNRVCRFRSDAVQCQQLRALRVQSAAAHVFRFVRVCALQKLRQCFQTLRFARGETGGTNQLRQTRARDGANARGRERVCAFQIFQRAFHIGPRGVLGQDSANHDFPQRFVGPPVLVPIVNMQARKNFLHTERNVRSDWDAHGAIVSLGRHGLHGYNRARNLEFQGARVKLFFLRHGEANWQDWTKPDDERPLTKKGRKQVEAIANALQKIQVHPNVILTSPLPRAWETANIVAQELGVEYETTPLLAPGFDLNALRQLLNEHMDRDIMFVGHEPDFSRVIALLTGGNVRMAKAGLARVDIQDGANLTGLLVWLAPPKILKEI